MVKIGLLDSGVDSQLTTEIIDSHTFVINDEGQVLEQEPSPDLINHSSAIARILLTAVPQVSSVNAQVFQQANVTAPVTIAAGLDWLVNQEVS